ncbi:hypothetical protein [Nitrospira sp. Nam74]
MLESAESWNALVDHLVEFYAIINTVNNLARLRASWTVSKMYLASLATMLYDQSKELPAHARHSGRGAGGRESHEDLPGCRTEPPEPL